MERTYRTKAETIEYFKRLAHEFSVKSNRCESMEERKYFEGKSESYELAAFELERNME